jgi:hypothetical protein
MEVCDTTAFAHPAALILPTPPCAAQVCQLLLSQPTHPALADAGDSRALHIAAENGDLDVSVLC